MSKKVAVITGANSGLGFATTVELCRRGIKVIMACRNLEKAADAHRRLLAEVPEAQAEVLQLDISESDSIHAFSRRFTDEVGQWDLLINNAGIIGAPLSRNSAGLELQFATNYLGAFILTGLLLPQGRSDGAARIINVGSLSNRFGKLPLDDLNWENTPYHQMKGYARSKLAQLTFAVELDRRLRASNSPITALAAHPGFANTEGAQKSTQERSQSALAKKIRDKMSILVPKPADAARPIVYAACSEQVSGGDYYGPGGFLEIAGKPAKAHINRSALDAETGKRLWALSESISGVSYLSDV